MSVQPPYEFQEHTADLAMVVRGRTWEELLLHAGSGLYEAIGKLRCSSLPRPIRIDLESPDECALLHDWLHELLFMFETRHEIVANVEFDECGKTRIRASAQAGRIDMRSSRPDHEIKAVTYHELAVEETASGWTARVILDI